MDNSIHIQDGDLDDDSDDVDLELAFAVFVLLGLALFEPYLNPPPPRRRIRDSALSGQDWVTELINGDQDRIFENLRMEVPLFLHLCNLLVERGYWQPHPTERIGVHESVAIALVFLSHNNRHRVLAERFEHFTETIDRHLRRCLRALVRLGRDLVGPRNDHRTHLRILNSGKFWPWFKDCIGAIDGTKVSAWRRADIRGCVRNRHGGLSQHVLAACDHDMRFVYVRVGWYGSAHHARVLQNSLLDPNAAFMMPPIGKYYAVGSTYSNLPGFMAPFKSVRGTPQERAAKSLFNKRHASLRSIIERTFGVLKMRFPILEGPMQNYMIATQNNIVLACCALHNFMREHVANDNYFNQEAAIGAFADAHEEGNQVPPPQPGDMSQQRIGEWNEDRRAIANHMYLNRRY